MANPLSGSSPRVWLASGAVCAGLAVAAGAFGAHALRERLSVQQLATFETGVRYQMYHALALFLVGWMTSRGGSALVSGAGASFLVGIVLFSGSLYGLSLTGVRWLGAITPLGGVAFLAGWSLMAVAAFREWAG
jgi:uncharacterized membrane protein YgdD (TMEM256/DUF423 family)